MASSSWPEVSCPAGGVQALPWSRHAAWEGLGVAALMWSLPPLPPCAAPECLLATAREEGVRPQPGLSVFCQLSVDLAGQCQGENRQAPQLPTFPGPWPCPGGRIPVSGACHLSACQEFSALGGGGRCTDLSPGLFPITRRWALICPGLGLSSASGSRISAPSGDLPGPLSHPGHLGAVLSQGGRLAEPGRALSSLSQPGLRRRKLAATQGCLPRAEPPPHWGHKIL